MAKILLVEDDPELCEMILDWLTFERHTLTIVKDGREGLQQLQCGFYDLAILDWELPSLSGIDILKQFRNEGGDIPILMLTGKGSVSEKTLGLDSGADDYLSKPFHINELSARLRALLRRATKQTANTLQTRDLILDPQTHTVTKGGAELRLVPKEFALLEFLMRHPNQVFNAEQIIQRVWQDDADVTDDAIRTCVMRLRKKIEKPGETPLIQTIYGIGYKLKPES